MVMTPTPAARPRPIHDRVGYANTVEIADAFAGFEDRMSHDQSDYFYLLCSLIADYENVKPPKSRGLVEPDRHVFCRRLKGMLANVDTLLRVA